MTRVWKLSLGEGVVLAEVALVGGVKPLHDLLHLVLSGLFDVHLLGRHGQDLLQFVALDLTVVVDVNHVESRFVDEVELVLFLHQLSPHFDRISLLNYKALSIAPLDT